MITISAFKWVPEFAQGQVRDLRARWALEEAGLPYQTRLLEQGDQDKPEYRALQPFGQVPILEEGGLVLFESGAIVLHIGERSEALLPKEAGARARATQWLISALNSIEPFMMNVAAIDLFYAQEEWAKLRRPGAVEFVQKRLSGLSKSLGDKSFLDGDRFTAGDLMMTTVLRILKHTDIVSSDRRLAAYIERCTSRPAFKRALDAQIGDFKKAARRGSMYFPTVLSCHMIETPQVVEAPAQLVATIHIETPRSRIQHIMGAGIGEAMAAVKAQGIGPAGPWFAHHLKMTPEAFDFDICVPVSAPVTAVGRVRPGERPAIKVVRTVYHGPYEGLGGAWGEFSGWLEANGYKTAGDLYECYVVGPESTPDPANWCTELSRPVTE